MAFNIGGIDGLRNSATTLKNSKLVDYKLGGKLIGAENAAQTFLKINSKTPPTSLPINSGWLVKNAQKGPLKYFGKFGNKLNSITASTTRSLGKKLVEKGTALSAKKGILGTIGTKLASNGTKMSKASVKKIPVLGTLFAAGEAIWGYGKAAVKLLQGDTQAAAHQAIKSTGTLAGTMAGLGLIAAGVVAAPFTAGASLGATAAGIGVLVGGDLLGSWVGRKVADKVCGPIDENGHSLAYNQKNGTLQSANQQQEVGQNFNYVVGGMNDAQFDQYLNNLMSNPALY